MSLATLCTSVADVQRNTVTAQPGGGRVNTWATVFAAQPCSIQPASASVIDNFNRREIRVSHAVYFPTLLALQENDRFNDGTYVYVYKGGGDMAGRGLYTIAYADRIGQ